MLIFMMGLEVGDAVLPFSCLGNGLKMLQLDC